MNPALLLVDLQNDFLPGGALAVAEGDRIVPMINRFQPHFPLVVATQDWHPADHGSFAANHPGHQPGDTIQLDGLAQVLWPTHCVQGSDGAAFVPQLDTGPIQAIFRKGTDPKIDSYSGFFDNGHRKSTGLAGFLREKEVGLVYIAGLATDYCVKYTALDARKLGFEVHVLLDACRGVELAPDDVAAAVAEMRAAGVKILQGDRPT